MTTDGTIKGPESIAFSLKSAWRALPLIVSGFIPQLTSLLVIGVAIAFARLVVVPLKQIGITYARMASAPRRVVELDVTSSPDLLVALLGVLAYSMTVGPMGGSLLLTLLVTPQMLIEPAAGVLYGYL